MNPVTAADVRDASLLEFDDRGYPLPGSGADKLQKEVDRASVYVEDVTGQVIADITDPSSLATKAEQAIQLRTEQQVIWRSDDYVGDQNESAIDISVTGYSQRRVGTKEQTPRDMVNPWPELNELLIGLMTDDKREYWMALGKIPGSYGPAEIITEYGWFE